ncbi:FAD-dependent oxidoreductase [Notoacmeibacter sp. MSK16QG-6]|uniref:FAD-dependent oxidoreductase n=1 Tax=Notoacmeibacter sp. MSK16QG-6 TaxID=2957982 RepID=UPI00209C768F|nr:FAD-dependent oxidoreductase [Notoacmeibacter sp. MSK16QG-6]MCP1200303.1 FAD-dependent oxidoreductase [Notoacmeibacter sp. MSK16QG-6]
MLEDRYNLAHRLYPYSRSVDQDAATPAHHQVIVIGGGPVGMAAALELGLKGIETLVLDDHEGVGQGSRAICFSKRCLEIAHRLGAAGPMMEKGVEWSLGRVFHGEREVFEFNLLPEEGHRFPAFINLQQPYFEKYLVERIRQAQAEGVPIEIRGRNKVTDIDTDSDKVALQIETPDGQYSLTADWVIAADGAGSPTRKMMGLGFDGKVFEDNFLIADVRMKADFPVERRFWFEPPFKGSGDSALLHKQPDGEWRIDFQIGWHIDREKELQDENIRARLDAMLSPMGIDYEIVWTSIYTFQCRRMEKFRHDRVIFVGDSCHQVSPFGARGCNSGMQDVDNLGWKLKRVIDGLSPEELLDSYDEERIAATDENILNSTRSTDFITPKSTISKVFRNAVLDLSEENDFARPFVNSGRLSIPATLDGSTLNTQDDLPGAPARSRPGAVCPDAPLDGDFLLDRLGGRFAVLAIGVDVPDFQGDIDADRLMFSKGQFPVLEERYLGGTEQAIYLIRPDQHVAGRWADWSIDAVCKAFGRATGMAEKG